MMSLNSQEDIQDRMYRSPEVLETILRDETQCYVATWVSSMHSTCHIRITPHRFDVCSQKHNKHHMLEFTLSG